MKNPLALFRNLRDLYLRYLDSPFDLRHPDLSRERRDLLDRDGRLWREPLFEPAPLLPLWAEFRSDAALRSAQHMEFFTP
jgi:hypothetical protein